MEIINTGPVDNQRLIKGYHKLLHTQTFDSFDGMDQFFQSANECNLPDMKSVI